MDSEQKKCVIYCRVSSKEQVDGTSLETQERYAREYAARQGWEVLQVFVEMGESAKTADRTEYTKAIAFCSNKKQKVDYFVVYKLDRFSRNTEDHLMVRAILRKSGTELRSVTEPINETPTGKLMEHVIAGFAEFDNNVRTERTKAGMRERVKEGIWVWQPQLGYHKPLKGKKTNIVPDQAAASLVRLGFEEYAKGIYTYQEIADLLAERGLKSRSGKKPSQQSIEKMLRNPVYCGEIHAFGGVVDGAFEPIVSKQLFQACQKDAVRQTKTINPRSANNPLFPLRKFISCAECGKGLTGSVSRGYKGRGYAYYHHGSQKCPKGLSMPKEAFEQMFVEHLDSLKPDLRYVDLYKAVVRDIWKSNYKKIDAQNAGARRQLEKLEAERLAIFDYHKSGTYTDSEFQEQKALVNKRMEQQYRIIESQREIEFDMEDALSYAFDFVGNAAQKWVSFSNNYPARIRFQKIFLKEKLPYDGEKFGTTVLSPILELKETPLEEKSLLVAPGGIEPPFPH